MSAPFGEGPTPWTDYNDTHIGTSASTLFRAMAPADDVRRLERRCRAAEAVLEDFVEGCDAYDTEDVAAYQKAAEEHLKEAKEMDR